MAERTRAARERVKPADDEVAHLRAIDEHIKRGELGDFEPHLRIDKHALDEALQEHPDLFYRISQRLVYLISQRDAAKQAIGEIEAEVDVQIRRDAEIAEEKITEKAIEVAKKGHRKVIAATNTHMKLVADVNRWAALKEAFSQRGHAMRELVALYGDNYWSDASSGTARSRNNAADGDVARAAMRKARREGKDT